MKFSALARDFIRDIPVYEPGRPIEEVARELGLKPGAISKLASNENPLGPSPKAVRAMQHALKTAQLYPDGGAFYLRQAVAKRLGVEPGNLIFGSGSNEVIEFLFHAFVAPGDEVIVGERAFVIYKFMAKMFQAACVEVPFVNQHHHDLPAMTAAITPRTKLVFVASPNNPTGTRVTNAALDRFIRDLPGHVIAVLDEAYYEFLDDPPPSVRYAMERNVVLLRTFSKIVGLAGLRIGYGIAQADCIALLERVRQPFNCNAIAQAGALAALADTAHIRRTRTLTVRGLAYFEKEFRRLGLEYVPSCANFMLVKVGDGDAVFRGLQQRGLIVRPMRAYKLPEWVRVSVGTMSENRKFVTALKKVLGGTRSSPR